MTSTFKAKAGDGSEINQTNGNLTVIKDSYVNLASEDERDFHVIDEIFNSVLSQMGSEKIERDKDYLEPEKKIKLNFPNEED